MEGCASGLRSQRTVRGRLLRGVHPAGADPRWARPELTVGLGELGAVGGAVTVGIGDLILGAAEHIDQPKQPYLAADFLPCLTDRRLRR